MKFIHHAEGYLEPDGAVGFDYVYQYKDHLGNIRLSYSDSNDDGMVDVNEIIEESNYYPFGLKHKGYNNVVNGQPNKFLTFNGVAHEEALGLNLYEMDFRQYDLTIARWMVQDPVTHWNMSPYNAFDNNPVFWSDPSGANAVYNWDIERYEDENGNEVTYEQALSSHGFNSDGSKKHNDVNNDTEEENNDIVDPLSSENNKFVDPEEDIKKYERNKRTIRRNSIIVHTLNKLTKIGQLKSTLEMVIEEWQESTREIITSNEQNEILSDIDHALTAMGVTMTTASPNIKIAATIISTSLGVQNIYLGQINDNILKPRIKRDNPAYYQENIDPSYHPGGGYSDGGGGNWKRK